ncbi:GntR family transcriptional regulator [Clostridia bacterium]|nr:GntR family transcriptional regulator [Clostridia bacterium]
MAAYSYRTENVRDLAYSTVKEKILSWELKPGDKVSEQDLSNALGVSRTPVREALMRLSSERLVEIRPQRGTFISGIDTKEFAQERFIRLTLEFSVMRELAGKTPAAFADRLAENIRQQRECAVTRDNAEYMELDDSFHRAFFQQTDKMLAWAAIQSMEGQCRRLRRFTLIAESDFPVLIDHHQMIMRHVLDGDLGALEGVLTVHINKLLEDLVKLKKEHGEYFI